MAAAAQSVRLRAAVERQRSGNEAPGNVPLSQIAEWGCDTFVLPRPGVPP
jgi:hypothetical protein